MKWRRGIYLILWILSLIGISIYGGAVSYGFFWGLTLFPVIILVYLLLVYVQFRIYQEIESRTIVCKQAMPYYFVLQNETFYAFTSLSVRLYSGFSYVTDMADDEEYEVLPGDTYTYHTKMICRYRGKYAVGVKEITITDIFGLFRLRYKNSGIIEAVVYPRIIHKSELQSLKNITEISYQETPLEQVEPDVVTRDYIPGDALKRIHWKVTAKEQKLKTRNLLGEREKEILILFDTKRYGDDMNVYIPLENQILEAVLALGTFFAEKNIAYTTICGQRGIKKRRVEGISQFEELYEEIAKVSFGDENLTGLMQQLLDGRILAQVQTLLVVTHVVEERLMKTLQMLSVEGINVVLYLVTDESMEEYVRQSNSRFQILVLPIESDLEELL